MIKELLEDNIFIDFSAYENGYCFGSDQVYNSYPCVFPTVTFYLVDTYFLEKLADQISVEAGLKPFFDRKSECDLEGWYDFTLAINGFSDTKLDAGICFERRNTEYEESGYNVFTIPLSEEEQKVIYEILNKQCLEYLGKSCDDLLAEARQELMELESPDRQDEELWV